MTKRYTACASSFQIRFNGPLFLQYFAVFCSPTAFFQHSYTSEQPPFIMRISRPGVPGPNSQDCGASPARIAIIAPTSPPFFVCFVTFVVPSDEHRFLRQLRPSPSGARCCISYKRLVKPVFNINLHHNIKSHNWLRAGLARHNFGFDRHVFGLRIAPFES
jgi:hypothetical protein